MASYTATFRRVDAQINWRICPTEHVNFNARGAEEAVQRADHYRDERNAYFHRVAGGRYVLRMSAIKVHGRRAGHPQSAPIVRG